MQKNIMPHWLEENVRVQARTIIESYKQITGIQLFDIHYSDEYLSYMLYHAPFVVVSHGTEADPVFNYANLTAQQLWRVEWDQFIKMPSKASVEQSRIEDRQHLLNEAAKHGFINNYAGVRIASTGKRFKIENVLLWNLKSSNGEKTGQAALFRKWTDLK